MDISNIDDLLMGGKTPQQPETPEHQPEEIDEPSTTDNSDIPEQSDEPSDPQSPDALSPEEPEQESETSDEDDYGNKKPVDNEVIRERLKKQAESLERKYQGEIQALRDQLAQQGASKEVQQAAQEFEYDPNAEGDWQSQLRGFIKQTVNSMGQEQAQHQARQREAQAQAEFEGKFRQGMSNFDDFVEVVAKQPITDAMTVATRAMKDPAAFIYAASKRHPEELARISAIPDQYVQMVEMGRLEERMRKSKTVTKAPKPLGKTSEDALIPHKTDGKEPTIEEMIARSEKKKLAQLQARRR